MAEFDVIALLEAKGIEWIEKGENEIAIICPRQVMHQDATDSNPSFNVNTEKGKAHCFSCGFKLNEIGLYKWLSGEELEDLQLQGMKIRSSLKRLKEDSVKLVEEEDTVFFPNGKPWTEDGYRGISLETYTKLGAVKVNRGRYENRICFPIVVEGEILGVDARYLGDAKEDKVERYLRNKNKTCKERWLFPYDIVKANKPKLLLIGEGIFHSINSLDKGINYLNFFGAKNWSNNKMMMLLSIGCEEVCFTPDPDIEGLRTMQKVCACLKPWFKVSMTDMSEWWNSKTDWGDLDKETMERLIENRLPPNIPICLLEDGWEDTKIEYGKGCKRRKCGFRTRYGTCGNELYKEQG